MSAWDVKEVIVDQFSYLKDSPLHTHTYTHTLKLVLLFLLILQTSAVSTEVGLSNPFSRHSNTHTYTLSQSACRHTHDDQSLLTSWVSWFSTFNLYGHSQATTTDHSITSFLVFHCRNYNYVLTHNWEWNYVRICHILYAWWSLLLRKDKEMQNTIQGLCSGANSGSLDVLGFELTTLLRQQNP